MIIYDASSFFERLQRKDLDLESFILDITIYEIGNVAIKHATILKDISGDDAKSLLKIVANWKNVLYLDQAEAGDVYDIAQKSGLTFYDAAYAYLAGKYGASLETCDKKLHRQAQKFCKVKLLEV